MSPKDVMENLFSRGKQQSIHISLIRIELILRWQNFTFQISQLLLIEYFLMIALQLARFTTILKSDYANYRINIQQRTS